MKKMLCLFVLLFSTVYENAGTKTVTLAWCLSQDTNVTGYKLYYGSGTVPIGWTPTIYDTNFPPCPGVVLSVGTNSFGTYTNIIDVGNTVMATVSNLTTGITYFFNVTAYDTNGQESVFANEIQYTFTNAVLTRPSKVQDFRVLSIQ